MDDREDLGALFARLTRALAEREQPLLEAQQLQMWDYVVLGGLEHGPAPTQAELAVRVRRDKTRLIQNLDGLEQRGLLVREPDPADRRNRVVSLTAQGRTVLARCRRDIRAMEDELLLALPPSARAGFLRGLATLAAEATDS